MNGITTSISSLDSILSRTISETFDKRHWMLIVSELAHIYNLTSTSRFPTIFLQFGLLHHPCSAATFQTGSKCSSSETCCSMRCMVRRWLRTLFTNERFGCGAYRLTTDYSGLCALKFVKISITCRIASIWFQYLATARRSDERPWRWFQNQTALSTVWSGVPAGPG